jgi:hypothetical protein
MATAAASVKQLREAALVNYVEFRTMFRRWYRSIAEVYIGAIQTITRAYLHSRKSSSPFAGDEVQRVCRMLMQGVFITPYCRIGLFLYLVVGIRGGMYRTGTRLEAFHNYIDYRIRLWLNKLVNNAMEEMSRDPSDQRRSKRHVSEEQRNLLQFALCLVLNDYKTLNDTASRNSILREFAINVECGSWSIDYYEHAGAKHQFAKLEYLAARRAGLVHPPERVDPLLLENRLLEGKLRSLPPTTASVMKSVLGSFFACVLTNAINALQVPDCIAGFLAMCASLTDSVDVKDSVVMQRYMKFLYPPSVVDTDLAFGRLDDEAQVESDASSSSSEADDSMSPAGSLPSTPLMEQQSADFGTNDNGALYESDLFSRDCCLCYGCTYQSLQSPRDSSTPPPDVVLNTDPDYEGVIRLFE